MSTSPMSFLRQPILLQDLRAWHKKPAIDKTRVNMEIHLREAQYDIRSLPISGSMFPNPQQANLSVLSLSACFRNRPVLQTSRCKNYTILLLDPTLPLSEASMHHRPSKNLSLQNWTSQSLRISFRIWRTTCSSASRTSRPANKKCLRKCRI